MKTKRLEELFDQLERSGMTVQKSRAELAALRAEVERLREAISYAKRMLEEHYDPDADESDLSPEDMHAHVNGLCVKRFTAALRGTDQDKEEAK